MKGNLITGKEMKPTKYYHLDSLGNKIITYSYFNVGKLILSTFFMY